LPVSAPLRRAVELAEPHLLRVLPNPAVGCVLTRHGRVVGEGAHRAWGGPHAEVEALRAAGSLARGATAWVTLEPCGHRGKTPPCAEALIRAGVREVIYAHPDPNPAVRGLGLRALRQAGVRVRRARAARAVTRLLEPYLLWLEARRPWMIAKWAMTLDGRIATRARDARWISGESARAWVHRELRARVDAVLVGSGTVIADDPALTNRSRRGRQPLRVVLCGRRPLPRRARVLDGAAPTLLFGPRAHRFPGVPGVETAECGRGGRVDLLRALRLLHRRGVRRLLVEGGGDVLGALFDRGLVDQVAVFVAPKIVGGIGAQVAVAGRGRARMDEALVLDRERWSSFDGDRLCEGLVTRSERP